MTVEELKKSEKYEFECEISPETEEDDEADFWGAGYIWFGNIGVEYNYCVEDGENYCAIYKMDFDEERGVWDTDGGTFIHYEVDFSDEKWKEKFENAMCEALIEFFKLA